MHKNYYQEKKAMNNHLNNISKINHKIQITPHIICRVFIYIILPNPLYPKAYLQIF